MGRVPGDSIVHGPRTSLLRHCGAVSRVSFFDLFGPIAGQGPLIQLCNPSPANMEVKCACSGVFYLFLHTKTR